MEDYHPDRMASRILGMGDVETLVERAQEQIDIEEATRLERRMRRNQFDMNDLLQQFQALKNMGPLGDVIGMIPGMRAMRGRVNPADLDERKMGQVEAIILSMTPGERANPAIIKGSRRKRIAVGSGTTAGAGQPTPQSASANAEGDEETGKRWQPTRPGGHVRQELVGHPVSPSEGTKTQPLALARRGQRLSHGSPRPPHSQTTHG